LKFTLNKLILKFIPYPLIRYVRKRFNANYLFFGASRTDKGNYLLTEKDFVFTVYGMEKELGEEVVNGFKACYDEYMEHPDHLRKYILSVEDCIIEPVFGWGITPSDDKLVFDSISNNTWRETYHPSWFAYKKNKAAAIHLDEVVSINLLQGGEDNYWHFLHDLLGQVILSRKHLGHHLPFLISKRLAGKAYFNQALQMSPVLAEAKWIIRDTEYYRIKKAWFVQPMPNSNEQFFALRALLQIPEAPPAGNRKIFLTRSTKRIRFLSNKENIENIVKKYDFEIIDTDGLSLQDQVKLFSETRWLIGIHGAGLTNILYRKGTIMSVFELLPGDYLQPHYFWLAKGMGNQYICQVGSVAALDTSFEINEHLFEEKIQDFVKS
jgi:hypothetical protein